MTVEGARMLKMDDRIGTLTPGKQADLIMIRADDLNLSPVHDAIATVVTQASMANVENVMIAGEWKKWNGKVVYPRLADCQQQLAVSGRRILEEHRVRLKADTTDTYTAAG
jgi:cytosine/adenosine deaminase-related metal-dependent hydrolase